MTLEALIAAKHNDTQEGALRRHETKEVLVQVGQEVERQHEQWGQQDWPDGTNKVYEVDAEHAKTWNAVFTDAGDITWKSILEEEVLESFAEEDPARLRAELVQVAAVAVSWIKTIDRRSTS